MVYAPPLAHPKTKYMLISVPVQFINYALIVCTSTVPALPSFKTCTNTSPYLDHVLADPGLFSSILSCCVGPTRPDSDHMPLELRIC